MKNLSETEKNLRRLDATPKGDEAKRMIDSLPPAQKKVLKRKMEELNASVNAMGRNGAGYPADKLVREFFWEYNNRIRKFGARSMPTSFNIAEAFYVFPRDQAAFFIRPESDFLFSFGDFLDFVTCSDAPEADLAMAYALNDGRIYNFNSLDDPSALILATDSGSSYGFSAVSMIRTGDELALMIECGEVATPEVLSAFDHDQEQDFGHITMGASDHYRPKPSAEDLAPVYIGTEPRLCRNVALVRFNLKERCIDGRILMHDHSASYSIRVDIREVFGKIDADKRDHAVELGAAYLDERPALWELAKTMVLLPAYLRAKAGSITQRSKRTELGDAQNSLKARQAIASATPASRILLRTISSIEIHREALPGAASGRSYVAPDFQVPVTGYWRFFTDPTRTGHDENGNDVVGRTWVRAHIRHKDKPASEAPKIVFVKASLCQAKALLAKYQGTSPATATPAPRTTKEETVVAPAPKVEETGSNGAFIYVMRCPAHGQDIYKVGFTTRDPEERARELSRATASPTTFLVVQAWAVTQGLDAEQAAHKALSAFRVSDNREFFLGKYAKIREAIETSITPWQII